MALAEIDSLTENSANKPIDLTTTEKRLILFVMVPGFEEWLKTNIEHFEELEGEYIRRIKIGDFFTEVGYEEMRWTLRYFWDSWENCEYKKTTRVQKSSGHAQVVTPETAIEFTYHLLEKYPDRIHHHDPFQAVQNLITTLHPSQDTQSLEIAIEEIATLQEQLTHKSSQLAEANKTIENQSVTYRQWSTEMNGVLEDKEAEIQDLKEKANYQSTTSPEKPKRGRKPKQPKPELSETAINNPAHELAVRDQIILRQQAEINRLQNNLKGDHQNPLEFTDKELKILHWRNQGLNYMQIANRTATDVREVRELLGRIANKVNLLITN